MGKSIYHWGNCCGINQLHDASKELCAVQMTTEIFNAWHPGLSSQLSSSLQSRATLFSPECSTVNYQTAREFSDFSGLKLTELVSFTAKRLITHELLIRVTSDLSVPDGPNYEDLGLSLRAMVTAIYKNHVSSYLAEIEKAIEDEKRQSHEYIKQQLADKIFDRKVAARSTKPHIMHWIFGKSTAPANNPTGDLSDVSALTHWEHELSQTDIRETHLIQAIMTVVNAIVGQRGSLPRHPDIITDITTNYAINSIGSMVVREYIDPIFQIAVEEEKYRLLPSQKQPVILNVKGASASGKSTIRSKQRELTSRLDLQWEDFALVSPDYWRKYLLDYESLGDDYKYAAMLTGQELEIIDKKLDQYMTDKANTGAMPHLLIDRFRFDSFSIDEGSSAPSSLLSRFGNEIFMFFMITPPAETVVRAWQRGQTTGRFKAVDDLLYHNHEAFTGMPALFLSWISSKKKRIHFEFLDNDVPKGQKPKTVAFGWNNSMTVLSITQMLNIVRFRNVNVEAKCADEVFKKDSNETTDNTEFLVSCIKNVNSLKFADRVSAQIYAKFKCGKLLWVDHECLKKQNESELFELLLKKHITSPSKDNLETSKQTEYADKNEEMKFTIGEWT